MRPLTAGKAEMSALFKKALAKAAAAAFCWNFLIACNSATSNISEDNREGEDIVWQSGFIKGPYLQDVRPDGVTIVWEQAPSTPGMLSIADGCSPLAR